MPLTLTPLNLAGVSQAFGAISATSLTANSLSATSGVVNGAFSVSSLSANSWSASSGYVPGAFSASSVSANILTLSGQLRSTVTADQVVTIGTSAEGFPAGAGPWDTTMALAHRNMNATGREDTQEFSLGGFALITGTKAASSAQNKAAVIGHVRNGVDSQNDLSVYTAGIGVWGAGYITNSITGGRVWGVVSEAVASSTTDGMLIGVEAGLHNYASVVTTIGDAKQKVNIWVANHANKLTGGIVFSAGGDGWHYGAVVKRCQNHLLLRDPLAAGAVGIDMPNDANWGTAIKIPNNNNISGYNAAGAAVISIARINASDSVVLGSTANSTVLNSSGSIALSTSAYFLFNEIADPAAPATNIGALYMRDNGGGKTQLVARFPTGAVQVIATEP